MTPYKFPEANKPYKAPSDLEESQCMTIWAYENEVVGGSVDGVKQVVVAWKPNKEELARIAAGEPIFISMLYGLAPHYPSTSFFEATHPA